MNNVHVACAFDKGMTIPAFILAYSIKKFASQKRKTIFHVLECEKGAFPPYADYLLNCDYFEVRHHQVNMDSFKNYDLSIATVPSHATFARMMIPQIISEADRVLYLDCDVIVNRPIDDLYDIEMNSFPIAVCRDLTYIYFQHRSDGPSQTSGRTLLNNVDSYFNAGVILIDCVKWVDAGYFDTIVQFLANPPAALFFADQDVLNAIFVENHLELDPRWNSWALHYEFGEGEEELANFGKLCTNDPWIIHFIGSVKPWISFHRKTDFHKHYWTVAAESPFLHQLITLYDTGPLEGTAYAKRPGIRSIRGVGEFLCTLSRVAEKVESAIGARRTLSAKLFGIGNNIYNNSQLADESPNLRKI